jgi:leucyl aminopeptidase
MRRVIAASLALSLAGAATYGQQLPVRGVNPLRVTVVEEALHEIRADVLIVPFFSGDDLAQGPLGKASPALAAALRVSTSQRALGSHLTVVPFFAPPGLAAARLLLVNAGRRQDVEPERLRRVAGAAVRRVRSEQVAEVAFWAPGGISPSEAAGAIVEGALLAHFDPGIHKTSRRPGALHSLTIAGLGSATPAVRDAIDRASALAGSQNIARSLALEPSNFMTPEILAQHARQIAAETGLGVEILDEAQIAGLGMGGVIAVGQGAAHPPRFIVLRYVPRQPSAIRLALAGKGVTFDSGGISLKAGTNMYKQKGDMAAGAAVIAAMRAIALTKPSIEVLGLVPAVMNLPSGTAQRPGDVFTSLDGKTVEVLNTDAEGRLILCDAIAYAVQQGSTHIVDVGTLTGSVVSALGDRYTGAFSSDDGLYAALIRAARKTGEGFWRLPIDEEYAEGITGSLVADLNETGGAAGASVGAKFLQQFTAGRPWLHLDIGGTSWPAAGAHMAEGPTGVTTRTLAELARELAVAGASQ